MMTPDRIRALVDNGYASQDEIDWMLDRALTEKDSPQKSQNYFRIIHQLANAPATEDMPGYVNPKKEGFDALYNEKTGQFNSGGYVIDHQTGKKTIIRGQPQQQRQDVDYSRPQMEIAGYGKGYYSKDGREVIGDGWVASLGRNVAQERQRKMEDLKMQEAQGAIRYNDLRSKKMESELNAPPAGPEQLKPPAGYMWSPDGKSLIAIPGGPAEKEKNLTDAQAKALLFSNRMESSNKILDDLAKKGVGASIPGSRTPVIGAAINVFQGPERQMLDQAKRDFINATLRRESGAVIAESEFENADKQYFPQIGDSEEVRKQKAMNRMIALKSIQAEVPQTFKAAEQRRSESEGRPMSSGGLPPKEQLVAGQVYETPRGRALWTGNRFELVR